MRRLLVPGVLLLCAACNDYSTAFDQCVAAGGCRSATPLDALAIAPPQATVAVGDLLAFSATGGIKPYAFTVESGGGTVDMTRGAYTAPAMPGTSVVRVADSVGHTSDATVTINPALAILPAMRTLAVSNVAAFTATGGVGPYTFSLQSGGGSVTSDGSFTAPSMAGACVVRATDALGNTADATVTVNDALSISPQSPVVVIDDTQTFTASGGVMPYSFSVFSGAGSVSTTGLFTAPGAPGSSVVRVTDAVGNSADAMVTVNGALAIVPQTHDLAVNDMATFSATGGVPPYAYSITMGAGSIDAASGVYTAPATVTNAMVRVTDSRNHTSDGMVNVGPALAIVPPTKTLAPGNSFMFTATGGVLPYTFSLASGAGSITSDGAYTAPNMQGTAVVRVTDTLNNTSDATVTINGALAISPMTKTLAVNDLFTFSATGGAPPYTFSLLSGAGSIGLMTGTYTAPNMPGQATVRVTDGASNTSDAMVTVNPALVISPSGRTLPAGASTRFTATGGVPPYLFSEMGGTGSVDPITGVYTASQFAMGASGTVRVTDSIGNISNAAISVVYQIADPGFFMTGANPQGVAAGDWDRDGKLDLLVANAGTSATGTLSLLLGAGNGTFGNMMPVTAGASPSAVVLGDFNGDGQLDAVVANNNGTNISLFLNVSGGVGGATNFGTAMRPVSLVAADFNRDGKLDVAVGCTAAYSILLGNGAGSFAAAATVSLGTGGLYVAAADFNGDGKLDLSAVDSAAGNVNVLLGTGTGTFGAATPYTVGASPRQVVTGDWNLDGKVDLAVANSSGSSSVGVLLGNGNGTFAAQVTYDCSGTGMAFGSTTLPYSLVPGDFNGDGKPDLAVANFFTSTVVMMVGAGDGSFSSGDVYNAGSYPSFIASGDFNNDGHPDLATTDVGATNVAVYLNQGAPLATVTFGAAVPYTTGGNPTSVVIGDWNLDGKLDLAVAEEATGKIHVRLGTGNGVFGMGTSFTASAGNVRALTSGDFNRDGKPDLAVAADADVALLLGNGNGTFQSAVHFASGMGSFGVAAADLNRDAKPDLVSAMSGATALNVLLGNGAGGFAVASPYAAMTNTGSVVAADFNRDGLLDLAATGADVVEVLLQNAGPSTFSAASGKPVGNYPTTAIAGDWDHDGKLDLAVTNGLNTDVSVLPGKGDGTFKPQTRFTSGMSPAGLAAGDINLDGLPDFVVTNSGDGTVSVLLGTGGGMFSAPVTFMVGANPVSAALADLNADGRIDIVVTNSGSSNLSVLLNTSL